MFWFHPLASWSGASAGYSLWISRSGESGRHGSLPGMARTLVAEGCGRNWSDCSSGGARAPAFEAGALDVFFRPGMAGWSRDGNGTCAAHRFRPGATRRFIHLDRGPLPLSGRGRDFNRSGIRGLRTVRPGPSACRASRFHAVREAGLRDGPGESARRCAGRSREPGGVGSAGRS